MQVSLALDRLLETVAEVAKDMREAGTKTILTTSYWIVGGSFFIALLNLFIGRSQAAPPLPSSRPDETTRSGSPLRLSGEGSKPALHTD